MHERKPLDDSCSKRDEANPVFAEPMLHVGRPNLGDREVFQRYVDQIWERRWLSNDGPLVQEFERRIASICGVDHCVAMCNATVALEILFRACDLTGEVIVPSFTFVATAHALQWQQITPVFADIHPQTYTLDPACVEQQITPKTSAIVGVHAYGQPCSVQALQDIAERHQLDLLFDAAHALGTYHNGVPLTSFGRASIVSFHATKFINSFEGGAVVTNDDDLAQRCRLMRNFGFGGEDRVIYIGTNGKMTEISAAMGLTSLDSMSEFMAINRQHYAHYRERLRDLPGIRFLEFPEAQTQNYQYIVVEIDETRAGVTRDEVHQIMKSHNVLARRYFFPGCHRMEPYRSLFPNAHLWLPETERISQRVLVLPTGSAVTSADVDRVCRIFEHAALAMGAGASVAFGS